MADKKMIILVMISSVKLTIKLTVKQLVQKGLNVVVKVMVQVMVTAVSQIAVKVQWSVRRWYRLRSGLPQYSQVYYVSNGSLCNFALKTLIKLKLLAP